jgi:group I intron endonuclease
MKRYKFRIGVYCIRNLINGKVYVGSAIDLLNRWSVHKTTLGNKSHHNKKLERAWHKYGAEAFAFEILEYCKKSELIEREQYWMDELEAVKNGYNLEKFARSALGRVWKPKSRRKASKSAVEVATRPGESERRSERAKRQHAEGRLGAATRKNIKRGFRHCENCGERFWQRSGHQQRFCSTTCSNRYEAQHRVSPKLGSKWSEETREKIMAKWTPERRAAVGQILHRTRGRPRSKYRSETAY